MAFSNGYTLGFAGAICLACSLGVASASMGLRPLQEANKKKEFQTQILTAVGLGEEASNAEDVGALYAEKIEERIVDVEGNILRDDADVTGDGVMNYLDVIQQRKTMKATGEASLLAKIAELTGKPGETVKGLGMDPTTVAANMYPVFVLREGGRDKALAFEMNGKGLWGPMSGYLALNDDGRSVLGVTFDAPKETPGLGAEIMYSKFRDQWEGKRIVDDTGAIDPIDVEKMCTKNPENCVDGVSGATITCVGVDRMVDGALTLVYQNYIKQIQSGTSG